MLAEGMAAHAKAIPSAVEDVLPGLRVALLAAVLHNHSIGFPRKLVKGNHAIVSAFFSVRQLPNDALRGLDRGREMLDYVAAFFDAKAAVPEPVAYDEVAPEGFRRAGGGRGLHGYSVKH